MSDPQLPTPETDEVTTPADRETAAHGVAPTRSQAVGLLFAYIDRLRRRLYEILGMFETRLRVLERGMYVPKPLKKLTELTTSLVTMYTVPVIQEPRKAIVEITSLTVTNYSASPADLTAHIIPLAGSAANSNLILDAVSVPAGETWIMTEDSGLWTMESGDFIQMKASANSALVVSLSGRERQ